MPRYYNLFSNFVVENITVYLFTVKRNMSKANRRYLYKRKTTEFKIANNFIKLYKRLKKIYFSIFCKNSNKQNYLKKAVTIAKFNKN